LRNGRARLEDADHPRAATLLNLIAALSTRRPTDLLDPGVLCRGDLGPESILLPQRETQRHRVVAELLPTVGKGGTAARRGELVGGLDLDARRVRNGARALDLAGDRISGEHEVGDGTTVEQLLASLRRLGTGDTHQGLGLHQG